MRGQAAVRFGLALGIVLVALFSVAVAQDLSETERTRAELAQVAAQIRFLSVAPIVYDQPDEGYRAIDEVERREHLRLLARVTDRARPKDALLALLQDGDPKIRTLAALALFDRDDPSVLPALFVLCDDDAPTFEGYDPRAFSPPEWSVWGIDVERPHVDTVEQTVGQFATAMISLYARPSEFAEYWEARRDRSHCASWFALHLARATQLTSPVRRGRYSRIRDIRKRIDELPADERAWVLLYLHGCNGGSILVTEAELVETCRTLGPDKLIRMLRKQVFSDDPSLRPTQSMCVFVLAHAGQLLRPEDRSTVAGLEGALHTPMCAVAAAQLSPENASQILHDAMKRFQASYQGPERRRLCLALWQLVGRTETDFIADCFYKESELLRPGGNFGNRHSFIQTMGKDLDGKAMIARLIDDARLADLDWGSLEQLVRVVDGWSETSILGKDERAERFLHPDNVWHPFGQQHYHWGQGSAERRWPRETAILRAALSEWRKRLRASVPRLLGAEPAEQGMQLAHLLMPMTEPTSRCRTTLVNDGVSLRLQCPSVAMAECISGGWTVLARDDAFLVVATRWDEHDRGQRTAPTYLMSTVVDVDEAAAASSEALWVTATRVPSGRVPGDLPSIALLAADADDRVRLIAERTLNSSTPAFTWTALPCSRFAQPQPQAALPPETDLVSRKEELSESEWKAASAVRDPSAPDDPHQTDLNQPSVASFRGHILLAGDARHRSPMGFGRGTWVGPLAEPKDRALDAVVLGPGWAPALVPAGRSLICFAVSRTDRRYCSSRGAPGSLVAWRSADGTHWEPWAAHVSLDNVVRVAGCKEGETTLVACMTNPPEERIYVYRLEPDGEGLTELLCVDPTPEGRLGRDIAIRLLKGTPYLFWQEHVGKVKHSLFYGDRVGDEKTFIVIRRLDLPTGQE